MVDIILDDGFELILYCFNMGLMKNCVIFGSVVWFLDSGNFKCKYCYIWELVDVGGGVVVGINIGWVNYLVWEVIEGGVIELL